MIRDLFNSCDLPCDLLSCLFEIRYDLTIDVLSELFCPSLYFKALLQTYVIGRQIGERPLCARKVFEILDILEVSICFRDVFIGEFCLSLNLFFKFILF